MRKIRLVDQDITSQWDSNIKAYHTEVIIKKVDENEYIAIDTLTEEQEYLDATNVNINPDNTYVFPSRGRYVMYDIINNDLWEFTNSIKGRSICTYLHSVMPNDILKDPNLILTSCQGDVVISDGYNIEFLTDSRWSIDPLLPSLPRDGDLTYTAIIPRFMYFWVVMSDGSYRKVTRWIAKPDTIETINFPTIQYVGEEIRESGFVSMGMPTTVHAYRYKVGNISISTTSNEVYHMPYEHDKRLISYRLDNGKFAHIIQSMNGDVIMRYSNTDKLSNLAVTINGISNLMYEHSDGYSLCVLDTPMGDV